MSFQEVKERIAQDILGLARGSYLENQRSILRFEVPCPRGNCLDWLDAQESQVKVYWASRDNSFQMAGIGIADRAQGNVIDTYTTPFNAISQRLSVDGDIRYYGGMDFYPPEANKSIACKKKTGREWKVFGRYCFLLPRFEIVDRQGKYFFACNIVTQDITESLIKDYLGALAEISFSLGSSAASIQKIKSLSVSPSKKNGKSYSGNIFSLQGK